MALSNFPPGVTDSDIDAHFGDDAGPIDEEMCSDCEWPSDECVCSDREEDKHDPYCGVNRVRRGPCDCWWDS